jgi:hypothetical protein
MAQTSSLALLILLAAPLAHAAVCPPANFDSVPNFNLQKFIQGPWFVQEQVRKGKLASQQQQLFLEQPLLSRMGCLTVSCLCFCCR